jgi:hypothetical protein
LRESVINFKLREELNVKVSGINQKILQLTIIQSFLLSFPQFIAQSKFIIITHTTSNYNWFLFCLQMFTILFGVTQMSYGAMQHAYSLVGIITKQRLVVSRLIRFGRTLSNFTLLLAKIVPFVVLLNAIVTSNKQWTHLYGFICGLIVTVHVLLNFLFNYLYQIYTTNITRMVGFFLALIKMGTHFELATLSSAYISYHVVILVENVALFLILNAFLMTESYSIRISCIIELTTGYACSLGLECLISFLNQFYKK